MWPRCGSTDLRLDGPSTRQISLTDWNKPLNKSWKAARRRYSSRVSSATQSEHTRTHVTLNEWGKSTTQLTTNETFGGQQLFKTLGPTSGSGRLRELRSEFRRPPRTHVWECHSKDGWSAYPLHIAAKLEQAFKAGSSTLQFSRQFGDVNRVYSYTCNFARMKQINDVTHTECGVRRRAGMSWFIDTVWFMTLG